jgi:beta-xylosidase
MRTSAFYIMLLCFIGFTSCKQEKSQQLISYTNPIIHADYSDPDAIRVGDKYYMTASSFNCIPGLPLLESDNLVDWKLVGYAVKSLEPDSVFSKPNHGGGIWAPSLRYHNQKFYIYYGDPDFGTYMLTADNFTGPWTKPQLVKAGKGWIDPCPFWDDNGNAWLIHAWAGSRAGIKSTLTLHRMSRDGTQLLNNGILIYDGHGINPTIEGPKLYKHNNFYYIFAPAGGVTHGWQLVLRSEQITGPYEARKVMHRGNTQINGPHQGAWVQAPDNSSWFIHFQDKEAFGRIVHLQPLNWQNNWPVIGSDTDNDGIGEPVLEGKLQTSSKSNRAVLDTGSDEFNEATLNLNWQWQANPDALWGAPSGHLGFLRLNALAFPELKNLWEAPNLLLQKFPSSNFTATTKVELFLKEEGDKTGLIIMGMDYAYLGVEKRKDGNYLVYRQCLNAEKGKDETTLFSEKWTEPLVYLQSITDSLGNCNFSFSANNQDFKTLPDSFNAKPGKWIGAKVGLFSIGKNPTNDAGYINADWFRFTNESNN